MSKPDETIYICCGVSPNYVMPLTVTLMSLFDRLNRSRKAFVYILDGGVKIRDRNKLLKSLKTKSSCIEFIKVNSRSLLDDMPFKCGRPMSIVTYYKFLIPVLLPENITKIIFLDSDLVVNEDVEKLWDMEMGENYLLAVPEDLPLDDPELLLCHEKLGIKTGKYFNGGVLVINLKKWREENLSDKFISFARDNKEWVYLWDQDCLNAVLANKWGELDYKWNLSNQILHPPPGSELLKDKERYKDILEHPYIIHFNLFDKPWEAGCRHPYRNLFIKYLAKTVYYRQWRLRTSLVGKLYSLLKNILPEPVKKILKKS